LRGTGTPGLIHVSNPWSLPYRGKYRSALHFTKLAAITSRDLQGKRKLQKYRVGPEQDGVPPACPLRAYELLRSLGTTEIRAPHFGASFHMVGGPAHFKGPAAESRAKSVNACTSTVPTPYVHKSGQRRRSQQVPSKNDG